MSPSHLRFPLAVVACVAVLAAPSSALGAAQRTFVKSTGVNNPACSLIAPCRDFAAAMLQTLPGGEVIVLDSAGYGAVTIAQSVSIIAPPGVYAGITASSGDGVTVNGTGIVVVLQGLTINGLGTGNNGINFSAGDELHVINGSISNFASYGISATGTAGRLFVSDTTVRGNNIGVNIGSFPVPGAITAVFERVRVEGSTLASLGGGGIRAGDGVAMSVRGSIVSNNGGQGVYGGGGVRITIDNTLIADSASSGARVEIDGASVAKLDVIRSTLTRNKVHGAMAFVTPFSSLVSPVMTVVSSVVTENGQYGIQTSSSSGNATTFVSGNTIAGNIAGGIHLEPGGGVVHTRSNNAGEQTVPTSGTVTAVPGF